RRADERGHGPGSDLHFHAVDGAKVVVEDVETLDVDLLGQCVSLSLEAVGQYCRSLCRRAHQFPASECLIQRPPPQCLPPQRPPHQRPAFGASALAMRRASRLSTMTSRTSTRAAAQARSELAIAAAPGETGRSCES